MRFLEHLVGQIPGKKPLIIWGGSPIHRGGAVKEFLLAGGGASRMQLEQLPGYDAPDLDPDEGIWKYLKVLPEVRGAKEGLLPEPL